MVALESAAHMRLSPLPPYIGEIDGFTKKNDLFELAEFGDRLANLVCRLDDPLVVALDGAWGSGKSTFVRQWAGLLRQRHVPVILFDAFANDHQEDAFISLAGEIAAMAQARREQDGAAVESFVDKAKKVERVLAPLAVRASMRAATLSLLSAEDFKGLSEDVQEVIRATAADASAVTEGLIEERLKQAEADRNTLETFRESLRVLAGQLGSGSAVEEGSAGETDAGKPLIFIIDELDRCRPPFALNLLERVKHLFSVENVCFVLVAHVPQLEAVIEGSYGSRVDARTYLEKFFHLRITLPEPDPRVRNRTVRYVRHLWTAMGLSTGDVGYDDAIQKGLVALSRVHGLSLRSLERVAAYVALVYAATSERYFREPCLVVGLCVMKQIQPDVFAKARSGGLTWSDARDFLRPDKWSEETAREWYERWWRYVTGDETLERQWAEAIRSRPHLFKTGLDTEKERIVPNNLRIYRRFAHHRQVVEEAKRRA